MALPDGQSGLEESGVKPWLVAAMDRIARDSDRSLDPWLVRVGDAAGLPGTAATCRCHFVRLDANGRPRVAALVDMLSEQIVDYCIPRSRIEEAREAWDRTGSPAKALGLQREAAQLFTSVEKSGEGGELLLYALLEIELGIPQVLCKMSLKTSGQMHYHGVDGVHAKGLEDDRLAIYWGEAKLYANANAAIDAAFESLGPYLLDTGDGASQRDVLLLREHADTGDPKLTETVAKFFMEDMLESSRLEVRGACLVGFSRNDYEHPVEDDGVSIKAQVQQAIEDWQKRAASAITNQKVTSFELEIFFVPFPSVADFRDELRARLNLT